MNVEIVFPVKSYVLKYLRKRYKLPAVYQFKRSEYLSKIIFLLLHRKKDSRNYDVIYHQKIEKPYKSFKVQMSENMARSIGYITIKSMEFYFNSLMDAEFREYLFERMAKSDYARLKLRQTLKEFGISEDEISEDTLYRDYIRKHKNYDLS